MKTLIDHVEGYYIRSHPSLARAQGELARAQVLSIGKGVTRKGMGQYVCILLTPLFKREDANGYEHGDGDGSCPHESEEMVTGMAMLCSCGFTWSRLDIHNNPSVSRDSSFSWDSVRLLFVQVFWDRRDVLETLSCCQLCTSKDCVRGT
jgi:hypothetical protein